MSSLLASRLLAGLDLSRETFALLGAIENDLPVSPVFQSNRVTIELDALPAGLRVDVAVVRPLGTDRLEDITGLLARLRDVHAKRVLFSPDAIEIDRTDLLALGFEPQKSPSADGLFYVWDPELADEPRDWNNSRSWANPENFSKYRW